MRKLESLVSKNNLEVDKTILRSNFFLKPIIFETLFKMIVCQKDTIESFNYTFLDQK